MLNPDINPKDYNNVPDYDFEKENRKKNIKGFAVMLAFIGFIVGAVYGIAVVTTMATDVVKTSLGVTE